ncbi:MAG: PilN domain-containing protein [Gammaproteobacteria bacterium]
MKSVNINLLPWRERRWQQRKVRFYLCFAATLLLAVTFVVVTHLVLAHKIDRQNQRNVLLREAIETYQSSGAAITQLSQLQDEWHSKMTQLTALHATRTEAVQLLNELVDLLPEAAYWQRIHRQDQQLTLIGLSYDEAAISKLVEDMASSTWLKAVQLRSVEKQPQDEEDDSENWQQFILGTSL